MRLRMTNIMFNDKIVSFFDRVENIVRKRIKQMLFANILFFSHYVIKGFFLWVVKKLGLCSKWLI